MVEIYFVLFRAVYLSTSFVYSRSIQTIDTYKRHSSDPSIIKDGLIFETVVNGRIL